MRKAIIISFYKSSNIGDTELSRSIDSLINENNFEFIRYDFISGERFYDEGLSKNVSHSGNGTFRLKSRLKKIVHRILGDTLYWEMVWFCKVSRKWRKNETLKEDFRKSDVIILAGGNMIMDLDPLWIYYIREYIRLSKKFNLKLFS